MDVVIYGLVAVLAGAAGYFGGRWHGAHLYAALKKQLEYETAKLLALLDERNDDYSRYKANHADQRGEVRRLEVELDKGEQRLQLQREAEASLRAQLVEQEERLAKFKGLAEKWSDERAELLAAQGKLQAESEHLERESKQLQGRFRSLEERFETAVKDKATMQEQQLSKEREAREYQRQAQKLEDENETLEFTLSQLRIAKEEQGARLAYVEGKLDAFKSVSGEA